MALLLHDIDTVKDCSCLCLVGQDPCIGPVSATMIYTTPDNVLGLACLAYFTT